MNQDDPICEIDKLMSNLGAASPRVIKRSFAVVVVLWLFSALIGLALTCAVIYVVAHFLAKWW